jgi:hypothetical protein
MSILKADGPSVAVIHFDATRTAGLRRDEIDRLAYHVARLLAGERTASAEWEHLGMKVEVEPDSDGGPEG